MLSSDDKEIGLSGYRSKYFRNTKATTNTRCRFTTRSRGSGPSGLNLDLAGSYSRSSSNRSSSGSKRKISQNQNEEQSEKVLDLDLRPSEANAKEAKTAPTPTSTSDQSLRIKTAKFEDHANCHNGDIDIDAVNKKFKNSKSVRSTSTTSANHKGDSTIVQSVFNVQRECLMKWTFFDVPCIDLAKNLLGQKIVRLNGSQRLSGKIVETEAYLGLEDKAAHSYKGKRTPRNEAMFACPGTCYVYNIYGMYCCMNISSRGPGKAVLIRAVDIIEGQDTMKKLRTKKQPNKELKEKELANGPSKLCQAFNISKEEFNKVDLTTCDHLWLEKGETVNASEIVSSARINIGYAEEWKDKPLRFYILGNKSVSVRDKQAEKELNT